MNTKGITLLLFRLTVVTAFAEAPPMPVVDTMQCVCYDERQAISPPAPGARFAGQDAQHAGAPAAYQDNGDGTISDLTTGLVWSKGVNSEKVSLDEAEKAARSLNLGGHGDWRVPTIKELYSLIDFRGVTGLSTPDHMDRVPPTAIPYINTDYFDFAYGQAIRGDRFIDAQWLSSTRYVSTTMNNSATVFGVNFADGRIKGYPDGGRKKFYVRYVRGAAYGANNFHENGDGTITDRSTGLVWMKADSGKPMSWEDALKFAGNLSQAGKDDWRVPNAKELLSIVDYTRSPDTSDSPAIEPIFRTTQILNEAGKRDWGYFWTSTTHLDGPDASPTVYAAFGRAIGEMNGRILDAHGAGAQRSDPKTGKAGLGYGPQGDSRRITNFLRCVRGGPVSEPEFLSSAPDQYPQTVRHDGITRTPEPMTFKRPAPRAAETPPDQAEGLTHRHPFVRRLDSDGDGRVSPIEFDGPAAQFPKLDENLDGFLTSEEAPSRQQPPPR